MTPRRILLWARRKRFPLTTLGAEPGLESGLPIDLGGESSPRNYEGLCEWYNLMRLTDFEVSSIRQTIHALDPDACIYLFGSRTDDSKRGGDIDLLIMSDRLTSAAAGPVRWRLWELIGEQKIDIVIAKDDSEPFVRIALKEGVLL